MNEYVNGGLGTNRPHKFYAEAVVIDWVKFELNGPVVLDLHSIHLPLVLKDNVIQGLSMPYNQIIKLSYPCPPSYNGCFLMKFDTDSRYFNNLIGVKDKSRSISALIITGYSWYDDISTVGFTLQWLVDNCRSARKLQTDSLPFAVKIMTRNEADVALNSFQMNTQMAVDRTGFRRFCSTKEKNNNQVFRLAKKRISKRRLSIMKTRVQRNESLIAKALSSLLKSTVKRINGYLFPSGFVNYLMNTARACSNLKEIACHVRAMYPLLIKQISDRDYWKKVVYFFPLVNGPQIRLLIWTYPVNCFFRCDQSKQSKMVLITPRYPDRRLNEDFPIAPLEAVIYDYFALDSAHARVGTPPNLGGISWVKMCAVSLMKYSETAIIDSIVALINECITSCHPYDVKFDKEVFEFGAVPTRPGRGEVELCSLPWPVYRRFLELARSTARSRLMFTCKKLFKDINGIHGFCVRDLNIRAADPDKPDPRPTEYMSGLRNWSFLVDPDPSLLHDFGNTKVFGTLKIDGNINPDLPALLKIQGTLKAYYSLEMTVTSNNIDVLTKFIHTGVISARIYLNSTKFNDLNTLFRVLYYIRNLQLIITKSKSETQEICLNDVRNFLRWWKDYFPKDLEKFTKVAAVEFGEYQLFVSLDNKLHVYSRNF